jgi:hypothetical protein
MVKPHQTGRALPHRLQKQKSTLTSGGVYQVKDGSTYPYTAYLGADTLYIHTYDMNMDLGSTPSEV